MLGAENPSKDEIVIPLGVKSPNQERSVVFLGAESLGFK